MANEQALADHLLSTDNWRVSAGDDLTVFIDNHNKIAVPCGGITGIKYAEAAAMARLIAQAPALLAHLEWAANFLQPLIGGSAQYDAIRATIASARGDV
jgi:hypothetical protein